MPALVAGPRPSARRRAGVGTVLAVAAPLSLGALLGLPACSGSNHHGTLPPTTAASVGTTTATTLAVVRPPAASHCKPTDPNGLTAIFHIGWQVTSGGPAKKGPCSLWLTTTGASTGTLQVDFLAAANAEAQVTAFRNRQVSVPSGYQYVNVGDVGIGTASTAYIVSSTAVSSYSVYAAAPAFLVARCDIASARDQPNVTVASRRAVAKQLLTWAVAEEPPG